MTARARTALLGGLAAATLAAAAGTSLGFIRLTNGATGLRFASQPIAYTIHASGSDDVGADDSEKAAIRLSFETWSRIDGSSVRFHEDLARADGPKVHANDGVNMVLFDESNSTGLFSGASFVIAITPVFYDGAGGIIDADVVFNGRDHMFATNLAAGRYDVQNIATHEIGHFLGFDHTGVHGASLVPFAYPQDVRMRSLAHDDRAAAAAVYPGPGSGSLGSFSGQVVRDATGRGVNGAHVVAVNVATGEPEASAITSSTGAFTLELLRPAAYRVYAEPLDGPCTDGNIMRNGIDAGFATAFYGGNEAPRSFSLAAGQRGVALGQLRVDELTEPFNIDGALPRGILRGTTVNVSLSGTGLQTGLEAEVAGPGVRFHETDGAPNRGFLVPGATLQVSVDANATPGLRDIYVRRGSGAFTEVVALPGGFEILAAAPRLTSLTPASGGSLGGETVTIRGSGFASGASVVMGSAIATVLSVDASGGTLTVTTPPSAVGAVPVTVINPDGQQARLESAFTFRGIPSIASISPAFGPSAGGVPVTLRGERFSDQAQVLFDRSAASGVVVSEGGTRLDCVAPRGAPGLFADVTVVNPGAGGGNDVLPDAYSYIDPEVREVDPAVGGTAGGTVVRIRGDGFSPGARVDFGATRASAVQFVSQYELRATAPARPAGGTVGVTVVTSDGRVDSVSGAYRYVAGAEPQIAGISPERGSTQGGDVVRIFGSFFDDQPTVLFGGVAAARVRTVATGELEVVTPPGAGGPADVVVRNASGLQGRVFDGFTYDQPTGYALSDGGGGGGGGGCRAAPGAIGGAGGAGALAPWLTVLAALAILRRRARLRAGQPIV